MSRVYVTSNRMRKRDGEWVPAIDLRPAERYGTLAAIFDHSMDPSSEADVREARRRFEGFDDEQDYVLPSGSPFATFTAGLLLRERQVKVIQVLEWDRFDLRYHVRTVAL